MRSGDLVLLLSGIDLAHTRRRRWPPAKQLTGPQTPAVGRPTGGAGSSRPLQGNLTP
jgi:hypothetical protein